MHGFLVILLTVMTTRLVHFLSGISSVGWGAARIADRRCCPCCESVARQQLPELKVALDAPNAFSVELTNCVQPMTREIRERSAAVTAGRNDTLATAVRQFEEQLVAPVGDSADILAAGISSDWSLQPIEVFHLPGRQRRRCRTPLDGGLVRRSSGRSKMTPSPCDAQFLMRIGNHAGQRRGVARSHRRGQRDVRSHYERTS